QDAGGVERPPKPSATQRFCTLRAFARSDPAEGARPWWVSNFGSQGSSCRAPVATVAGECYTSRVKWSATMR
ncbi:MAG: hypothetical protein AAFZ06_09890, partial [Pseudomonadota bacterium]